MQVTVDLQITDMKPEVDSSYAGGLKEIQGVPPIGLAQVIHSSGDITNVVHCINYRMFSLMEPFKNYSFWKFFTVNVHEIPV